MAKIKLSKRDKILLTILDLSSDSKKNLKFEDVVVAIFKKFPNDFHLKGYKKYPDADAIRRPLYKLRDDGVLLVRNMIFSFTDKGLDEANKIKDKIKDKKIKKTDKFDRYIEKEISRIQKTRSYYLYIHDKFADILDTDFYDYIGTSVKADRISFKARLNLVGEVYKLTKTIKKEPFIVINQLYKFMLDKFEDDIEFKLKN